MYIHTYILILPENIVSQNLIQLTYFKRQLFLNNSIMKYTFNFAFDLKKTGYWKVLFESNFYRQLQSC